MSKNETKRKYEKKNTSYWNGRIKTAQVIGETPKPQTYNEFLAETYGEKYTATAALGGGDVSYRGSARKVQSGLKQANRFENLRQGILPYESSGDCITMSEAITLCQKAHANVAVFRNTIEIMTEFSNAQIVLKGGNKKSREAVDGWLKRINAYQLKEEFFREYYRSGNVFIYRFDGKIKDGDFEKLKEIQAAKSNIIPVRYIILNPATIGVESGISYKGSYVKMLSQYEIERLRSPKTTEEIAMYDSLPAEIKKQINNPQNTFLNIYMPLDKDRLHFVFYKKQSYEPLAIPMGFPVLNDIEFKLKMKRMDMALAATIENVLLIVTTGEKVDQYGGGCNPAYVKKLQELFKNETLGRVLVGDHTLKATWTIPDIAALIGEEKYKVVNRDIQEGLQSILVGEDKFANSQTKVKVFMERLKGGQDAFLNNFLQSEINKFCEAMNFKAIPQACFEKIDLEDKGTLSKVYIRMAELGLITPQELTHAMDTGILPDKESNIENQKEYKELRDKGYYFPLVGGSKEGEEGRPAGSKAPQTTKKISPIGTKAEDKYSFHDVVKNVVLAQRLTENVEEALKKKFKVKELNAGQQSVALTMTRYIISNEQKEQWFTKINDYIAKPKDVPSEVAAEIQDIAITYDTDTFMASVLYKSKV
jgi:hypothetical protein